jgi:protein-S-isoprenylcysteine O-methyltransferase Ste14
MWPFLARRRVSLGFFFAAFVVYFSRPTGSSILWGAGVGAVGESIRLWAAGHLEKSREVTSSGPYRFTRHPLYVGSSLMAVGVAVASRSLIVAALVLLYMGVTLTAAIRSEEAYLRERFGDAYDAFAESRAPRARRQFSLERAWRNKEYRAMAGFALFLMVMMARLWVRPD